MKSNARIVAIILVLFGFFGGAVVMWGVRSSYFTSAPFSPKEMGWTYTAFGSCSLDALQYLSTTIQSRRVGAVAALARQLEPFDECSRVAREFASRLKTNQTPDAELLRQLKNDFDQKTDTLYYYYKKDKDDNFEQGWMTVRGGRILKKYSLASGS